MTDQCGVYEFEDMVGHLADTLEMFDVDAQDLINPMVYVFADLLAQYTDGKYESDVVNKAVASLLECYKFHCSSDEETTNITVQ